ncbi:pyridoxamine 5'-phosphate oxidase family protein [Geminicoccus harenae]|uniref:pyridoxamine 5'-phosphate oxidase family protein n=1 Tax=Geminicoccus harenae TaxID=2498453 RepID=UPI00168AD6C7|nr:pyridoxamine 5'-phosphate oxidase family protein [Geminicoccus harenae]
MAKQYQKIEPRIRAFIERQRIFFTGTAADGARVNISPRGTDLFRILDENRVAYLDLTGSGSETAAHLKADGRMTIMFCAFEGPPQILRLFGRGTCHFRGSAAYAELLAEWFGNEQPLGARQIVVQDIDLVQTSCGFGVPLFDYHGERDSMERWALGQGGEEGLRAYRLRENVQSIDGLPTGMPLDQ